MLVLHGANLHGFFSHKCLALYLVTSSELAISAFAADPEFVIIGQKDCIASAAYHLDNFLVLEKLHLFGGDH